MPLCSLVLCGQHKDPFEYLSADGRLVGRHLGKLLKRLVFLSGCVVIVVGMIIIRILVVIVLILAIVNISFGSTSNHSNSNSSSNSSISSVFKHAAELFFRKRGNAGLFWRKQ